MNPTDESTTADASVKRTAGRTAAGLLKPAAVIATTALFVALAVKLPPLHGD
jgi:hypothetical protein